MTSRVSVIDSDDSSDSHPSILIINPEATSSSSSSSSSAAGRNVQDWNIKYRKLPKKRSVALRFMTWAAGRPRKADLIKKKYRDDDVDSELFRVSTTTLIGSILGRWPRETRMYWVTMGHREDNGDGGDGGSKGDGNGKKGQYKRRVVMMSGGSGNGSGRTVPTFVQMPGVGIPPPIPPMDTRFSGTGPRFPPGMGSMPPLE